MTHIYYGCDEVPEGWDRYFAQCNALEVDLTRWGESPPTIRTLNSWRVDSPRGFCFVLHLDEQATAALLEASRAEEAELGEAFERGWERTLERAEALAARALMLSTPPGFSPNTTNRALIEAIGERGAEIKQALLWEPSGPWEPYATRDWAAERGVEVGIDPFLAMREGVEPGRGDVCHILRERAGMRRQFDQFDMEDLLDRLSVYQRAFVLLRGRYQWDHARELRHAIEYDEM